MSIRALNLDRTCSAPNRRHYAHLALLFAALAVYRVTSLRRDAATPPRVLVRLGWERA
jgi:hypothetical protein